MTEKATCRGCHRHLDGAPYHTGKPAYLPENGKRALAHHFGGWVCSATCERRIFEAMRAEGVWGSREAELMALASDRHAENRK